MTTISAVIVADSVSPDDIRLTTMHLRYPRFIHAEVMTHRVFSRNARSSRAVPVETMLKEIETDPVIPLHWGANQKGMQADRECSETVGLPIANIFGQLEATELSNKEAWLWARDQAVKVAGSFATAGYHKQVVNRLLEPFMHIDVLVSATEWANFLALRDHRDAEPHIQILAREVRAAMNGSSPLKLQPGEWHIPYIERGSDEAHAIAAYASDRGIDPYALAIKISVARCARISYRPFDGNSSIEAEIARHDALVGATPMHASPAEHQATPDRRRANGVGGFDGWWNPDQHGNFTGWRQYRKTLPGENLRIEPLVVSTEHAEAGK